MSAIWLPSRAATMEFDLQKEQMAFHATDSGGMDDAFTSLLTRCNLQYEPKTHFGGHNSVPVGGLTRTKLFHQDKHQSKVVTTKLDKSQPDLRAARQS